MRNKENLIFIVCFFLILALFGVLWMNERFKDSQEQDNVYFDYNDSTIWWDISLEKRQRLECEVVHIYYTLECDFEDIDDIVKYCSGIFVCEDEE